MDRDAVVVEGVYNVPPRDFKDRQFDVVFETSPALKPPAWVNFLKQGLHLLHLDCKHVGARRIVVMSTPHAAESVARLVLSAMQCADHYLQTAVRNT